MSDKEDGQRLHDAIRAALETASHTGRLRGSTRGTLEATLAQLDEKLGGGASTDLNVHVESVVGHCLVMVHTSDPGAVDVIASFMHHAGAGRLGTAKVWSLPLGAIPVNRWIRALQRVLRAEQRSKGHDANRSLPVRMTAVWAHENELVMADVG
jgi:hypothetical protein